MLQVAAIDNSAAVAGRMARTASKTESQLGIILRGGSGKKLANRHIFNTKSHVFFTRNLNMILNLMCKVLVCHKTDFKVYRGTSLDDTTHECQILRFVGGFNYSCQHAIGGAYFLHTKIIPDGGHLFLAQKIYKNFKPRKPEIYFLHKKIIPDGGTYFWHKRFIKNFKPRKPKISGKITT